MKLYYSKGSCSLAVRIVINELSLTADYEAVDLKTKKTESGEDFLHINPKGSVPVLLTDEKEILTENAIIQQYLADKSKTQNLLPPVNNFAHYRVLEWLNYVATDLHKSFGPLFNPQVPQQLKDDVFIPALQKKFAYVDKHLANRDFLMGKEFTLPDGYCFVVLNWANKMKIDLSSCTNLTRYFSNLQKHASIQKSLQEEGLLPA